MKIEKEYILREIAGDYIIVPVGAAALEFNGMITVNETGAFLWEKLREGTTREELLHAMLEEYEVSEKEAEADIQEFLQMLQENKIL
ncbi:MAG: PqqD family protein [Tyzzerella sp.]|nr:PqqD family protein [Tyzzerella sp.]